MLGTAALVLQVINVTVWNRFWPFFALIFMHLIAALIQFVRMVLLPPHGSEQPLLNSSIFLLPSYCRCPLSRRGSTASSPKVAKALIRIWSEQISGDSVYC